MFSEMFAVPHATLLIFLENNQSLNIISLAQHENARHAASKVHRKCTHSQTSIIVIKYVCLSMVCNFDE